MLRYDAVWWLTALGPNLGLNCGLDTYQVCGFGQVTSLSLFPPFKMRLIKALTEELWKRFFHLIFF